MAKRIFTIGNYILIDEDNGGFQIPITKGCEITRTATPYQLNSPEQGGSSSEYYSIAISDANNWYKEDGSTAYNSSTLLTFLLENTSFRSGGSASLTTTHFGLIDYNDSTGAVSLTADTWTDVPNDGLGAFTNKTYKPTLVSEVMDNSTGYLDFSDLTLGSQLVIRNDFSITPSTNNALLEVRYLLGQGAGEYPLLFWSERLDNGSGISYQRVPVFSIYMGDNNTKGGVGKLQVKLSTTGTLTNAGSYINIQLR